MTGTRRGWTAVAAVLAGYLGASVLLGWASAGVVAAVRSSGPAPLDAGLGLAAAAAAWLVLSWLVLTALLALAATALAQTRPRLARLADRVTPALVRRAAAAVLGASLAGGSLASGALAANAPAYAAGPASANAPAYAAGVARPAAGTTVAPALDRPAEPLPGWTPDRPATRRAVRAASPVHLVTTAPHPGRAVSDEVVVRRGDTLWDIAARYLGPGATAAEVAGEWPRWHRANRDLIGPDPGHILPGQQLRPPGR